MAQRLQAALAALIVDDRHEPVLGDPQPCVAADDPPLERGYVLGNLRSRRIRSDGLGGVADRTVWPGPGNPVGSHGVTGCLCGRTRAMQRPWPVALAALPCSAFRHTFSRIHHISVPPSPRSTSLPPRKFTVRAPRRCLNLPRPARSEGAS